MVRLFDLRFRRYVASTPTFKDRPLITIVHARMYAATMSTDRRILDAAAAVFHERGFHGAGMDEIGARAGLTGPALYRHFSGKDEILATLFDEAIDELLSAAAPVRDDPYRDLDRLIRHHVQFAVTRRHLVSVYQREDRSLVDPWKRRFYRRREQYVTRWEDALARCLPDTDPKRVAVGTQSCLGLIFSIALWPPAPAKLPNLGDFVVAQVLEGIGGLARA
jgi:AcrR family transcriptional regulator